MFQIYPDAALSTALSMIREYVAIGESIEEFSIKKKNLIKN